MLVGVQPARAGTLLDDLDGGTPQRVVWVPPTWPLLLVVLSAIGVVAVTLARTLHTAQPQGAPA